MAKDGVLRFPIVAVNDAMTKYLFDNRYGTGQSTLDGILRATNRLMAGGIFSWLPAMAGAAGVCYHAGRAWAPGWRVISSQPLKALEALMDGCEVLPMGQAARRSATSSAPSPATSMSSGKSISGA